MIGSAAKIEIVLDDSEARQFVEIPTEQEGKTEKLPLYIENETVSGKVQVQLESGKKLEHNGISVSLIGATSKPSF